MYSARGTLFPLSRPHLSVGLDKRNSTQQKERRIGKMRSKPKDDGEYLVTYHIVGTDYNAEPNSLGERPTAGLMFKVKVSFSYDPDDYGNGYYMGVEGENEPWGCGCYDIRYDGKFNPKKKISYIAKFFENRYDGENGAWTLLGIKIAEADFSVLEEGGEQND